MCSSMVDCTKYEFSRVNFDAATFLLAVIPPKEPLPLPQRNGHYLVIDAFDTQLEARSLIAYLKTKFVKRLVSWLCKKGLDKVIFEYVPVLDFKEAWTDEKLCDKYGLTQEERDFVKSMIMPMGENAANDGNPSGVCYNG